VFAYQSKEEGAKRRGLTDEDQAVLAIVEHASTAGAWSRDIRTRSGLPQAGVARSLKALEARQLIKSVRSVEGQTRKVYLLFELEPDRRLTGGAWYSDRALDLDLVEQARELCHSYLLHGSSLRADPAEERRGGRPRRVGEIAAYVRRTRIFHVDFSTADVHRVVMTLVYDGRAVVHEDEGDDDDDDDGDGDGDGDAAMAGGGAGGAGGPDGEERQPKIFFRAVSKAEEARLRDTVEERGFAAVPCGACPVIDRCTPGGPVSPERCEYLGAWLDGCGGGAVDGGGMVEIEDLAGAGG